ncbi:globin [Actinocrinis puniceicyclus]|uniref:Globin n=1 Tax=Actinocrinis puniceicyclus TaxID=977794 RepID=A0A8J8BDA8_9ACTN|nr:globin [Actinocrinis puniceicyclus]
MPRGEPESFYVRVGGEPTFRTLVHRFYEGVAQDPELRAMYPEEDLRPAAERLTLFLIQYWGGPSTYSDTRGHPRLRMRHAPFRVDAHARDLWLHHMAEAVRSLKLPEPDETELWQYLERAAHFMVNAE